MTSRTDLLSLFSGHRLARVPRFSGLINVTTAGLDSLGLRFSEIHTDARKLAAAASTSYRLFGWESAAVPADLCVEASALGATVDFHTDVDEPLWPVVARPLAEHASAFRMGVPPDLLDQPRIATVIEAIRLLKEDVGREIPIGAWTPGPLTLALQLIDRDNLYSEVASDVRAVARALDLLTDLLIEVARAYRAAGADVLTIHEMGGSPGVIGPRAFRSLLLPRLQRLLAALPAPRVLSICGRTNEAMALVAEAGADAISVDQTNDLARSRAALGDGILLFGNIDPVRVMEEGNPTGVRAAVLRAIDSGVDAVWPGCDLPPRTPPTNMRAFVE